MMTSSLRRDIVRSGPVTCGLHWHFTLMWLLVLMAVYEPMLYCLHSEAFPTADCPDSEGDVIWWYSVFSMIAMAMHWVLVVDMAVFSTKLSAFLLVFTTVLSEVGRFLVALGFLILTFASGIACLRRENPEFTDIPTTMLSLFAITVVMMPRDYRELQYDPALLVTVFIFVTASVILLLNLLIAQLNCSYEFIYQDMLGYARLQRACVIVESLETCNPTRWTRFVSSLRLEQRVEFNEGDVGLAGAIQLNEPASVNPITTETILRYGGECSPEMRWPEDKSKSSLDRFDRMESLVRKALKKVTKIADARGASGNHGTGTGTGTGSSGNSGASGHGSSAASDGDHRKESL